MQYWEDNEVGEEYIPYASTWLNAKQWNDTVPEIKKEIKFKDEQDKEIFKRNENLADQSKRFRHYMKEATEGATEEVPNLLEDFKKGKDNGKFDKDIEEVNSPPSTPPENNPPL